MWFRVGDWPGSAGMISDVEGTCAGCWAAGVVSGNKGVLLLVSWLKSVGGEPPTVGTEEQNVAGVDRADHFKKDACSNHTRDVN